jgi:hypothetical protein
MAAGQIDGVVGRRQFPFLYVPYVSYVVAFCLRALRDLRAFVVISCGLEGGVTPC